ncbi:tetratricopeptide repeat-containing sensor histidine kinase [Flavobacterium sp.]|uniref:tetratricopeptide repeat-containing sensor histidine kinase n=1 Tax=Flavobacterium sp. TaxID=239 RepID=UPI002B4AFA11|nr:histidine kinase [Flavobacterium sp.]HLP64944.1 histidine kinase [Flavobacterium sp.]
MSKSQISIPKFVFLIRLLLLLGFINVQAQNKNLDSLKAVINSRAHDTTKLKAISFVLVNTSNTSKQYNYYNELFKNVAIRLLKRNNTYRETNERAYDALGVYYMNKAYQNMQSDYLLTIKYLNKSLEYYSPKYFVTQRYKPAKGYVLMNLGVMYNKIGNTSQSINNYFEALHVFEDFNDKTSISYAFQSIANLYFEQEKFNDALNYYTKAYNIYYKKENLSFQDNIQKVLLFISIGKTQQELNNCEQCNSNLTKALTLALKLNDKDVLSEIYFNLGRNEERCKGNLELALTEYKKSLSNSKLPENNANSLIAIGRVLHQQNKFSEAEHNLTKGLEFAKNINHLEFQKHALEQLYQIHKKNQQFAKALIVGERLSVIKDSIKKEENDNLLTKKQLQYEYEAKQSQLKLQQERKLSSITLENQKKNAFKNSLLIGLSSLLILLVVGAYFLYKNYKQKQAIAQFEKSALNQKLLLSQMNPHFIFNSIDNIQSLIYTNQSDQALNYLTKFSKLTRQILENSSENYISLEEELMMIDNYLSIQKLLYNNKFDFTINTSNELETEHIFVPPMLTQPFIENAIKHGLINITEKGQIRVRFELHNGKLFFEVTDNGTGFSEHQKASGNKSLAMKITKERLMHIANTKDFEVQTENLVDEHKNTVGAKVSFEIPYIYEN